MTEAEVSREKIDETYTNISFFLCDSKIAVNDVFSYPVGEIYETDRPLVLTSEEPVLESGTRIYIATNRAERLPGAKGDANPTTVFLPAHSKFKLITRLTSVTQAVLFFLHLPDEGYEEFRGGPSDVDQLLTNVVKGAFEDETAGRKTGSPDKAYLEAACPEFKLLPFRESTKKEDR